MLPPVPALLQDWCAVEKELARNQVEMQFPGKETNTGAGTNRNTIVIGVQCDCVTVKDEECG